MTSGVGDPRSRREVILLLLICSAFAASVAANAARAAPFEYDESVYAVQARAWAAPGEPVTGVKLHRAPLLPALGSLIYRAGGRSEAPYRATGLAFGVASVVLVWALGRAVAGPAAGLIGAAAFASAPPVVQRSAQFMTDVPATAFLLGLVLVLWRNRERAGPSLLLAAPLAAGAFYLRYASVLPIALLAAAVLVVGRRGLLRDRRLAIATALLFAGLLVPHVVRAVDATGRPWGLLTFTAEFPGRRSFGAGWWDYLRWFPFVLAGPVAGVVMIAGIAGAARRRFAATSLLAGVAVLDVVLIGLTEHAEPRFVFFPVALLCVAGGAAVGRLQRERWVSRGLARAGTAALGLALIAGGVVAAARPVRDARLRAALAGRAVAARAGGRACSVRSIEVPVVTWYSGCATLAFGERPGATTNFVVLFPHAAGQPAERPPGVHQLTTVEHAGRVLAVIYAT